MKTKTLEELLKHTIDNRHDASKWDDYSVFTSWVFNKTLKHDQRGTVLDTYFGACGFYADYSKDYSYFDKGYKIIDDSLEYTKNNVTDRLVIEEDLVHIYCALFYSRNKYLVHDIKRLNSKLKEVMDIIKAHKFETVQSLFMDVDYNELALFEKEHPLYNEFYDYLSDMSVRVDEKIQEVLKYLGEVV